MPRISVCIPAYNGEVYIAAAVDSVLRQTCADFELILCDDASGDRTIEIASSFEDARLRVVVNPIRLGLVGNWNRCLELAKGDYIVLFHQDDLMYPENLRLKLDFLDHHDQVGFVFSDIDCINDAGEVVSGHWAPQPSASGQLDGESFYAMVATAINPVACPSVMVRRSAYEAVGYYDQRLPFAVDLEMWLRLAAGFQVGYLSDKLVAHRLHQEQEGSRFRNTGRDALDFLAALDITNASTIPDSCRTQLGYAYSALSRQSFDLAKWQGRLGHIDHTMRYLWVALLARSRTALSDERAHVG